MKSRTLITLFLLTLAITLVTCSQHVYAGGKLIKSSIVIDGKSIPVETIRPEGRIHVELRPIIRGTGWRFVDRGDKNVYIKNKKFPYVIRYQGKLYANATALGKIMGYQVSIEQGGDLINFFPKAGKASKGENSVEIEVRKKEKFPSEKKGWTLYKLKIRFKNKTDNALLLNTGYVILLKSDGKGYFSETGVSFAIKADEEKTIDRVYFMVPDRTDIEYIGITNKKRDALIGKTRW